MQSLLAFLGVLMAIYVWNAGHPFWALVVGFLFVGGAGWMLPVWIARGVASSRAVQPKAHARLDALLIEWRARGNLLSPPADMARAYLDGFGSRWHSPSQFLDAVATEPHRESVDHEIIRAFVEQRSEADECSAALQAAMDETESLVSLELYSYDVLVSDAKASDAAEEATLVCRDTGALTVTLGRPSSAVHLADGPSSWAGGSPEDPSDDEGSVWLVVDNRLVMPQGKALHRFEIFDWLNEHWPSRYAGATELAD